MQHALLQYNQMKDTLQLLCLVYEPQILQQQAKLQSDMDSYTF